MIIERSPNQDFNNGETVDGVCPVINKVLTITVGTNREVVAAVSGKRIRVVGGRLTSTGAFTRVEYKSASAGTFKSVYSVPANTVDRPNVPHCILPGDEFETATGEGLYADNSAVDAICSISYYTFTPK